MSRWLKSVNHLLENLDGQAEAVAEGQAMGKFRYPAANPPATNSSDEDEEYITTDDDEDDYLGDDDDYNDVEVEDLPDEKEEDHEQSRRSDNEIAEEQQTQNTNDRNIESRDRGAKDDDATMSDLSNTDHASDVDLQLIDEAPKKTSPAGESQTSSALASKEDTPPHPPNRHISTSGELHSMAASTGRNADNAAPSSVPSPPSKPMSPRVDESPRYPQRYVERSANLENLGPAFADTAADETDPPRRPHRQPSYDPEPSPPQQPPKSGDSQSKLAPPKDVTKSKEYLKLKEKLQAIQGQLAKAQSETKTSQIKIQSLQNQNQTLESKLEAAHSEIQAQSDELRRAGERMEKDRRRAQEEREDLLDEQDEEIEQLKQSHTKEMDGLRAQYEAQIADLTEQLHTEESRRQQEGGDYTQELQDAIERERTALKQLNQVTAEKSQLQTSVSKLEGQQTTLQGKLDSALQSVKTATEREREAEDKLDAAMSLHSRQMSQRQAREAELEKTIFELGTALALARQKQSAKDTKATASSLAEGESLKEKYAAAAEEVETLKVQLNMETQRREAIQEELNEMSKERSEEISTSRARQRLHDRKVSELESTVARLQAQIREYKNVLGKHSENGNTKDPAVLASELRQAQGEIENLSSQLMRHQNHAETSKSEMLALKGRLQAATIRAERAEHSLQVAQSEQLNNGMIGSRMHEMETGVIVGGMRRRFKGGNARSRTRTIRAALHMSPGRTNHPLMEQLAVTLDALDKGMVETGAFLRHEPLARLGFMLYLIILHLWSFSLVVFHITEQPHADFGSLDNNPRHWRAAVEAVQKQQQIQP